MGRRVGGGGDESGRVMESGEESGEGDREWGG